MPSPSRRRGSRRRPSVAGALASLLALALAVGAVPAPARAEEPLPSPSVDPLATPTPAPTSTAGLNATIVPPDGPLPVLGGLQPVAGQLTFYGRGYGHGVGMSQWGARGRALAGQNAETILAHYYASTSLGFVDPASQVRVLLVAGWTPSASLPARVVGRSGPWTVDGIGGVFPAEAAFGLWRTPAGWQYSVTDATGLVLATGPLAGEVRIRPAALETRLLVAFKSGRYTLYRGVIRLVPNAVSNRVIAVNDVALDEYLLGVVPIEMPSTWPFEALRAQAVAARTYALKRLHPAVGRWDVYDDTRSQVYRGVLGEKPSVTAAVAATAGQVLFTASGAIANPLFHSTGGGATENNEYVYTRPSGAVYVRPASELRGSSDRAPDGTPYDRASPSATWSTGTLTVEQFSAMMAADARTNVGLVTAIDLSARGVSGRLVKVTLIGTAGSRSVSGTVFRTIFNARRPAGIGQLRSTLFDLTPIG